MHKTADGNIVEFSSSPKGCAFKKLFNKCGFTNLSCYVYNKYLSLPEMAGQIDRSVI
jgi:hypothetical protein